MDTADSYNRCQRIFIEDSDHHGQQDLLDAADKPEILGDGLEVGSKQIYCSSEGVIPHPLRLYHFFLSLQEQQEQDHYLQCQKNCRKEGASGREARAEGEVGDLCEDVDVDFDEREIEERNKYVKPEHVVESIYNIKKSYFAFVFIFPFYFYPLNFVRGIIEMGMTLFHTFSLWPFDLLSDHLHISSLLQPVPPKSNNHSKDQNASEDYQPSELITEEVGCLS